MESILNFRAINDLKTKDNAQIKNNKLFRSAAPEYGSPSDFNRLSLLNLNTIIDFRADHEKNSALQENFNEKFNRQSLSINIANLSTTTDKEVFAFNQKNIRNYYNVVYKDLPIKYSKQYKMLMQNINSGETLLFHCTAGKDRTGFAAYLILSALNVHADDILEDYLQSNATALQLYESRKKEHDKIFSADLSTEIIQELFGVKEEYLHTAIKAIHENFTDIHQYLKKSVMADFNKIQQYYLE